MVERVSKALRCFKKHSLNLHLVLFLDSIGNNRGERCRFDYDTLARVVALMLTNSQRPYALETVQLYVNGLRQYDHLYAEEGYMLSERSWSEKARATLFCISIFALARRSSDVHSVSPVIAAEINAVDPT